MLDTINSAGRPVTEGIGRSIVDMFNGSDSESGGEGSSTDPKTAYGYELLKKFITGGALLGGGVSAGVALINHLKSLREEEELEDAARLNDDTLYIPTTRSKEAADLSPWLAPGVGIAGGILAAGGAYALVQGIYNKIQRSRRLKQLDEAQGETLLAVDNEIAKSASNNWDWVTALPVAAPLLVALATGGVTYAALSKAFPTVQRPKSDKPKRIRRVTESGDVIEEEEETTKQASLRRNAEESASREFLTMMVDSLATAKGVEHSITSDILNKAAKYGVAELERTYTTAGLVGLLAFTKGASDAPASTADKVAGALLLHKSAMLSPIVASVAAAEHRDITPNLAAPVSVEYEDGFQEKMATLAAYLHINIFRPILLEKGAASAEVLQELLAASQGAEPDMDELTSEVGGAASDDISSGVEESDTDSLHVNNEDEIDALLGEDTLAPKGLGEE